MIAKDSRADARAADAARVHAETACRVWTLQTILADIDETYAGDLDTVRKSDAPEVIKQDLINRLTRLHQEHRAPYARKLEALEQSGSKVG